MRKLPLAALLLFAIPAFVAAASCPSLSRGSTGSAVSAVQQVLFDAYQGFPSPTGYFGPVTEQAVKQWQKEHGIESIGIVGPKTAAAMHLDLCAPSSNAPTTSNPNQSLIDTLLAQVKVLQAKLAALIAAKNTTTTSSPVVLSGGGATPSPAPASVTPSPTPSPTPTPTRPSPTPPSPAPTPTPTPAPTPPTTDCANLFTDGFPMGGYGGDYYESGGNVTTVSEMKRDGWNVDGPLYRAKPDAYLDAVANAGICTVFTPSAWGVDNSLATRIFVDGVFSPDDENAFLNIVRTQVTHVLSNPSWDATIAGWYISESDNESSSYIALVRDVRNLLRDLDPKHRVVMSWMSREAPTGAESLIPYLDGVFVGHYIGFADNRAQFLFAAERATQIKTTYGAGKVVIIDPPMCESTTDWTGQCGPAFGLWSSAQIQSYSGKFVRHDIFALIASGMRGFMVFSFSDRSGFADYDRYYGSYAEVVREIRASGLYDAMVHGSPVAVVASVNSGAATVSFAPVWDGSIDRTYSSVNVRAWTYAGKTYIVVSNTSTGPVTATLRGVPDGSYTDYIRGDAASASGGSMSVSITGLDAAVYIR